MKQLKEADFYSERSKISEEYTLVETVYFSATYETIFSVLN